MVHRSSTVAPLVGVLVLSGCWLLEDRHRRTAPDTDAATTLPPPVTPDARVPDHDASSEEPDCPSRIVEITFAPSQRVQLAAWLESVDGTRLQTVLLTASVGRYGIGNRPGAMQMNSGFRWPYGRREGVLPYWAHRRVESGGAPFPRVIFQDRASEGFASRTADDFSPEPWFCLSFDRETTREDRLDAVSCASQMMTDKGRYLTAEDLRAGYAEPFEGEDGTAGMRPLDRTSLYPPRTDLPGACASGGDCLDHPDIDRYASDARGAMPELDAVTRATPAADLPYSLLTTLPDDWTDDRVVLYVEANTEGDDNGSFSEETMPTPSQPIDTWDEWAIGWGYAYRGQPSVVFRVEIPLDHPNVEASTDTPAGYTDIHGLDGELRAMGLEITDNPASAPGSGADRLHRMDDGSRIRVTACR